MPIKHIQQIRIEAASYGTGVTEFLEPVNQPNLVLAVELIVVSCLRGHLPAVDEADIVDEMHQAIRAGQRYRGAWVEAFGNVSQSHIGDPRLLAQGSKLPRTKEVVANSAADKSAAG